MNRCSFHFGWKTYLPRYSSLHLAGWLVAEVFAKLIQITWNQSEIWCNKTCFNQNASLIEMKKCFGAQLEWKVNKLDIGYFLKKLFQCLISQTILLVCSVEFVEPPFLWDLQSIRRLNWSKSNFPQLRASPTAVI